MFPRHLFNAKAKKYDAIFVPRSWASRRGFGPINEIVHTNNSMEMSPPHRSLTLQLLLPALLSRRLELMLGLEAIPHPQPATT